MIQKLLCCPEEYLCAELGLWSQSQSENVRRAEQVGKTCEQQDVEHIVAADEKFDAGSLDERTRQETARPECAGCGLEQREHR